MMRDRVNSAAAGRRAQTRAESQARAGSERPGMATDPDKAWPSRPCLRAAAPAAASIMARFDCLRSRKNMPSPEPQPGQGWGRWPGWPTRTVGQPTDSEASPPRPASPRASRLGTAFRSARLRRLDSDALDRLRPGPVRAHQSLPSEPQPPSQRPADRCMHACQDTRRHCAQGLQS